MAQRRSTEERRTQIAEAALRIISTQGVHRLTAMELAREVGIADGTIFRHFKDKAEIIDAAVDRLDELLGSRFPPPGGDPLERLKVFFLERLDLVRSRPEILRLAFGDRSQACWRSAPRRRACPPSPARRPTARSGSPPMAKLTRSD